MILGNQLVVNNWLINAFLLLEVDSLSTTSADRFSRTFAMTQKFRQEYPQPESSEVSYHEITLLLINPNRTHSNDQEELAVNE